MTRAQRALVSVLLALILAVCQASSISASCATISLPTDLVVIDQFRAPLCRWCSGNRGIEYRAVPGNLVSAATSGIATFVGVVAGTLYVVIKTSNNVLVTHGRLASVLVKTGSTVEIGQAIGLAGESLYIGVRIGGQYSDPTQCAGHRPFVQPRAILVAG